LAVSNEQRAISIRQPWAYAILHLGKDVENRPMRTHYRGRIFIQASLTMERDEARQLHFLICPKIVRAAAHTLQRLWDSEIDLNRRLAETKRARDLVANTFREN
jgi:hypothetical protein